MMSRYVIPTRFIDLEVTVGWDNGLATYFGQVIDTTALDDETMMVLWVGTTPEEIGTVAQLETCLHPYAILSQADVAALQWDCARSPSPTPLQQTTRDFLRSLNAAKKGV